MDDPQDGATRAVRDDLAALLGESNGARTLDSLELLAVFAYLDRIGVDAGDDAWERYPRTIDDWVRWIDRRPDRPGAAGVLDRGGDG